MTLHSMTAFARETSPAPGTVVVELRSVNHRYLDCHFKLPDALRALEPRLREALAEGLPAARSTASYASWRAKPKALLKSMRRC